MVVLIKLYIINHILSYIKYTLSHNPLTNWLLIRSYHNKSALFSTNAIHNITICEYLNNPIIYACFNVSCKLSSIYSLVCCFNVIYNLSSIYCFISTSHSHIMLIAGLNIKGLIIVLNVGLLCVNLTI